MSIIQLKSRFSIFLFSLLLLGFASSALGQSQTQWNGEWIAEGTLFRIGVSVEDDVMQVTQIESMGQVWTNEDGEVEGNIVRVKVDYMGATGVIQAELLDATTAVAFAASCAPEFMVVCALSKGRQAIFKKVAD